jgi:hypothetical protein
MHELGHVATYVARPWKIGFSYDLSGPGWTPAAPEYASAGFEDAMATHYGSMSFWYGSAETPTTCLTGGGHCYNASGNPIAGTNIEATSYPAGANNCVAGEDRWPLSVTRFLWDVFDARDDAYGDGYSAYMATDLPPPQRTV